MAELTKVKKSVMEESQVLPDMDGQSGKVLSNDGSKLQWIEIVIDNEWRPGDIKMFAGSESQIQDGWRLCNGVGQTSNGINIPDLRDRFIVGSGSSYSTGSKGGSSSSSTNSAGSHSHSVNINPTTLSSSQIPSHNHTSTMIDISGAHFGKSSSVFSGTTTTSILTNNGHLTSSTGGSGSHYHSAGSSSSGNHSHSVNITPPYYALAFIIKL